MRLVLSEDAEADLIDIATYTRRRWGLPQARRYGDGLVQAMRSTSVDASLGRSIEGFPTRFRKVTYKSHHLYFIIKNDDLVIVRILHQAQDPTRYIAI